jgi:hypothetical protein
MWRKLDYIQNRTHTEALGYVHQPASERGSARRFCIRLYANQDFGLRARIEMLLVAMFIMEALQMHNV